MSRSRTAVRATARPRPARRASRVPRRPGRPARPPSGAPSRSSSRSGPDSAVAPSARPVRAGVPRSARRWSPSPRPWSRSCPGAARSGARRSRPLGTPSRIRVAGASSAASRMSPAAAPANTSAAAVTPTRGARRAPRHAAAMAAATSGVARGASASARPAASAAMPHVPGPPRPAASVERRLTGRGGQLLMAAALPERFEALLAYAVHVAQLRQRPEAAVHAAVLDDALRDRRPDAVELVELVEGRSREAQLRHARHARRPALSGAGGARRGAADRAPAAPRKGTTTCWPSSSLAARLTPARSARRDGPPARSRASATRALSRNPHQPGAAHRTGDVDVDSRAGAAPRAACASAGGPRCGAIHTHRRGAARRDRPSGAGARTRPARRPRSRSQPLLEILRSWAPGEAAGPTRGLPYVTTQRLLRDGRPRPAADARGRRRPYRTSKPRSPSGGSSRTSTAATAAPRGPREQNSD